jgi:hypothetical protein
LVSCEGRVRRGVSPAPLFADPLTERRCPKAAVTLPAAIHRGCCYTKNCLR